MTDHFDRELAQLRAELETKLGSLVSDQIKDQVLTYVMGGDLGPVSDVLDVLDFATEAKAIGDLIARIAGVQARRTMESIFDEPVRPILAPKPTGPLITIPPDRVVLDMAFDVMDADVVRWSRARSAQLVVQINDELRSNIRREVLRAVGGEMTTDQIARRLARTVPLHDRFANAVVRREGVLLRQFLASGMDPAKAYSKMEYMSARYAAKLRRVRATTIARTEVMTASNYGQYVGHQNAVKWGLTSNPAAGYRMVTREWITAEDERVCPVCGPLDKVEVDWAEPFPNGLMHPPAHPNCRCSFNVIDNADQFDYDGAGTAEQEYPELVR